MVAKHIEIVEVTGKILRQDRILISWFLCAEEEDFVGETHQGEYSCESSIDLLPNDDELILF